MRGRRLLAVDDDPGILAIIREIATELGFEVETLTKSTSFMTTYVRVRPDVVTLDVVMPDMDGIELIRWLSDIGSTAGVIILSGGNAIYLEQSRKIATARGALRTSVLAKPFRVTDLRTALIAAVESPTSP